MRIKKKNIRESIEDSAKNIEDAQTNKKEVDNFVDTTTDYYEKVVGANREDSANLAVNLASSALKDNLEEASVSDSQRKFFNAVHKCKTEGDCGSKAIKDAAEGMSLKDIEDFAFTKGKLPKSVDEDSPTGEDFGDIPTGRDLEVDADEYEEQQRILKKYPSDNPSIDLDSIDDGLPFESIRPKMTKGELIETVMGTFKNISENLKTSRKVLKTIKIKDIKK